MASFSLRKAAHVRNRIEAEIERLRPRPRKNRYGMLEDDRASQFLAKADISVFANPRDALEAAAAGRFEDELELVRKLERILGSVRAAIAAANGAAGISALLAKAVALRAEGARIDETLKGVEPGDPDMLKAAVSAALRRFETSADTVQATVTVGILDAERIAELKDESAALRREANAIDDRVAELNLTTKVEIDDADAEFLARSGIV